MTMKISTKEIEIPENKTTPTEIDSSSILETDIVNEILSDIWSSS